MASPNHTVVVSVLGLSRLDGENFSSHQGIGKSCLCYRFMYPGYDDYQQDHRSHCSLLALHEFESDVILREHFLYWGSTTRTYDAKGSSEKVDFEVLEYPVFYEDITDQPFRIKNSKKSIRSLDGYMKMVLASTLDAPGKMSYKNRDLICSPQDYGSVAFPLGIGKHRRGYVVVIDVSDNGPTFESRLRLTEQMVAHLARRKQKFICAATKRDESFATSLEKLSELARRNKFKLIEVSAKSNVNVSEMFEIVAAKVLGKTVQGLHTHVPPYSDAAQKTLSIRDNARQAFRTYLQKRVTVASELLKAIKRTEEYKACAHLHGKFETDKMFAQHVLTLRNDEVSTYANVTENVETRQQFLEAYVAERMDLSPYTRYLKDLIIKICQMCSNKVPILPSPPHTSLELNASTTDLTTIPNLLDYQQNTAGKQNNGDLCIDCGKATQKIDKKDSIDTAADTIKSGSVTNICGGYTITKMTMERNGDLTVLPPVKFQNSQEVDLTLIPKIRFEKTALPPDATIQTTEIRDFINNDAVTQEVDEEDGIYSVIEDCITDLHPHVSIEDGESTEGQDDGDNYSYAYICKSRYEYDTVGSDSDEYVPMEIEMCDEDDHEYINTSEIPGLDTEIVAVPQLQQPAVQIDSRPIQLDPSSTQLLQPLAQLPAQEEEQGNDEQLLLTQGNTHPTSMATSEKRIKAKEGQDEEENGNSMYDSVNNNLEDNNAWNDSDEYIAMTGMETIDNDYVNMSEIEGLDLRPVNASAQLHQPSAPIQQPSLQLQEACAQLYQSSINLQHPSFQLQHPSSQLQQHLAQLLSISAPLEQPASQLHVQQPSAQEKEEQVKSDDQPLLAQRSTTSTLMAPPGADIVDPIASSLSRPTGTEDQSRLILLSVQRTQQPLPPLKAKPLFPKRDFMSHKPDLTFKVPHTTGSERSAYDAIDPEVVTMPGDGGAAARIAMVNDDNLKSAMELGASKESPLWVAMHNVTSSENNALNRQVEKSLQANIRMMLGIEKEKAKNDNSFIAPLPHLNPDNHLTLIPANDVPTNKYMRVQQFVHAEAWHSMQEQLDQTECQGKREGCLSWANLYIHSMKALSVYNLKPKSQLTCSPLKFHVSQVN